MVESKIDYIVVGQGIAGTWIAYELLKRGHKIQVINYDTPDTSSLKAAGLYNPITGRKMVKTWLGDHLFASLEKDYQELEKILNSRFLHGMPIYRPFKAIEEKNDWEGKVDDDGYSPFIDRIQPSSMNLPGILDDLGGIIIKKTGYVDLPVLINSFKKYLQQRGIYFSEKFDYSQIQFEGKYVQYKNMQAKKVIFCEGPQVSNPFWKDLPFKLVRGELIDIECGFESEFIINKGLFMIPKGNHFTVGSTYDHSTLSFEPQQEGISNLKQRLANLFNGPYRIVDKRAGVRPATFDRKPFIGTHPEKETLGIFNGFGTKGVSLTPYFAKQYVNFLEGKETIEKEADVKRVY